MCACACLCTCVRVRERAGWIKGVGTQGACHDCLHTACMSLAAGADDGCVRHCRWGHWGRLKRVTQLESCEARYDFVIEKGINYLSNEYTLHGGLHDTADVHVCPQFFNVILVR